MRNVVLSVLLLVTLAAAPPATFSRRGMVASDHRLASQAGATILAAGGNSVDAAIATALMAGVVQPSGSGLGGGGFAVVREPNGQHFSLDFREKSPKASHRDVFVQATDKHASMFGGLAVAIPGESQGLLALHKKYGSLPLQKLATPAIEQAEKGLEVGFLLDKAMAELASKGQLSRKLLLHLFGQPTRPKRATIVHRKQLAHTLRTWVQSNGKAFTEGWVARDIVQAVQAAGGILSLQDMKSNDPRPRKPVTGTYRGWKVISMAPPSSGGVVLLQSLKVLENYNLQALGHNSSELLHLYAEVFQHAFADRAQYMGDPDRVSVPTAKLLSAKRIVQIKAAVNPHQTLPQEAYGSKLDIGNDAGTQHISVIDAKGMAISLTTTINTSFGSLLVAPSSGILLNNEMDDFVARPGVPNAYGLIGSESNSVAPHAVPLSSMTPTILISPDKARIIAIGASGGPFIISSTLQAVINMIDFQLSPSEAVSRPRIHHQWVPRKLFVDDGIPTDVQQNLKAKGHALLHMPFFSSVQVVQYDAHGFLAASDPRKGGTPAGW